MFNLMAALLSSRTVVQPTQVQPMKGTVAKVWSKAADVARQPGYAEGFSIHATRDILTVPSHTATRAATFITISGVSPSTPTVVQVGSTLGSNAPMGGQP